MDNSCYRCVYVYRKRTFMEIGKSGVSVVLVSIDMYLAYAWLLPLVIKKVPMPNRVKPQNRKNDKIQTYLPWIENELISFALKFFHVPLFAFVACLPLLRSYFQCILCTWEKNEWHESFLSYFYPMGWWMLCPDFCRTSSSQEPVTCFTPNSNLRTNLRILRNLRGL